MYRFVLVFAFLTLAYAKSNGGRIVGGFPIEITEVPHQLSLQYLGNHICGASIITANTALTAAHCTQKKEARDFTVRAGSSKRGLNGQVRKVTRIIQHELFNPITVDYDIAVLKLENPLIFGKGVQPIRLTASEATDGKDVLVSGWGRLSENGSSSNQLQAVYLNILPKETCSILYNTTERMICAGKEGHDSCQGDSGGPLTDFNPHGELIGIVSFGYGCARPRIPGIYTSIPNLRNWINLHV